MSKLTERQQFTINNYMHLGLLPFFACALTPWVYPPLEAFFVELFLFYASLILVFLSGVVWAVILFGQDKQQRHLHMAMVFSLWPLAAFFLPQLWQALFLMAGFLLLLFWEKLFLNHLYPQWYQQSRHKITFVVVACHMLTVWNIIHQ